MAFIVIAGAITVLLTSATGAAWLVGAEPTYEWVRTLAVLWGLMVPIGLGAALVLYLEGA